MGLWRGSEPLVLASKSPVRRAILEAAGLPVDVRAAELDERALERDSGERAAERIAAMLAAAKATAAVALAPDRIVVAADQTLACNGRIYAKPQDRAAAREQLASLRGRPHELHAAVAVIWSGRLAFEHVASARLQMRAFSDAFLECYLDAAGEAALGSVGGYQIERLGIHLFESIDGDYTTILGLPLLPLLGFLRARGWLEA